MNYDKKDLKGHYEDKKLFEFEANDNLYNAKRRVEEMIAKLASREKLNHENPYYKDIFDDFIWIHLERTVLYERGYVCNLKKWRKARCECQDILYHIRCDLEIERRGKFFESPDLNDPPIPIIPMGPIFEVWKSYSIVVYDVNCYGFGDRESLLSCTEELSEKYYGMYLRKAHDMKFEDNCYDNGYEDSEEYQWIVSSYYEELPNEYYYRG
jgi:hypothetical protein